ncbi:unnamed protein product [Choristocarpus tenellus]
MYAGTFVSRFGTVATFSAITGGRTVTRAATMLPGQRAVHIVRGGSMSAGEFINETVESSNVAVFSKSYCPFCAKTKALFSSLDVEFTVVELDQRDDGAEIQAALADKTGQVRLLEHLHFLKRLKLSADVFMNGGLYCDRAIPVEPNLTLVGQTSVSVQLK